MLKKLESILELAKKNESYENELLINLEKIKPKCMVCNMPATRDSSNLFEFKIFIMHWCDNCEPESASNLSTSDNKNAEILRKVYKWLRDNDEFKKIVAQMTDAK